MGTVASLVKYRRDADFAGQPPSRVITGLFPTNYGVFFYRLSILPQYHRQGGLWDNLVDCLANHRFSAQSGDLQKSSVYRNEAKLTFGFDSQLENDVPDGVVN